jgi:hypothetical protein
LIDPETVKEIKQLKLMYELSPDNVSVAAKYSQKLAALMIKIFNRQDGTFEELAAFRTLFKVVADVYRRHSYNETVAVCYLCGISYLPEYHGDDAVIDMFCIVNQFPHNKTCKVFYEHGLFFLIMSHIEVKDVINAELDIEYLERFHLRNPDNESIAAKYALTLAGLAVLQDFFKRRETAAKLRKLAMQYPNNENIVKSYESIEQKFPIDYTGFLLNKRIKQKHGKHQKREKYSSYARPREGPLLDTLRDIFGDTEVDTTYEETVSHRGGDDEDYYDDNGHSAGYSGGRDDSGYDRDDRDSHDHGDDRDHDSHEDNYRQSSDGDRNNEDYDDNYNKDDDDDDYYSRDYGREEYTDSDGPSGVGDVNERTLDDDYSEDYNDSGDDD